MEPTVPEPDVKIVRGRSRDYVGRFPTTLDVALVVEVSDSTLPKDRSLVATYAAEGIPIYWLVNLTDSRVEVYSDIVADAYTRCTTYGSADEVPVVLDGREVGRVRAEEILP
jgi:Uma2 family endonuclease